MINLGYSLNKNLQRMFQQQLHRQLKLGGSGALQQPMVENEGDV
jgi:hypothetical protein